MAEITAALVKDLREKTGAGMMDCKRALSETGGDLEAAVDWLRKKGLAAAAKKAGPRRRRGAGGRRRRGHQGRAGRGQCRDRLRRRATSSSRLSSSRLPRLALAKGDDLAAIKAARAADGKTLEEGLTSSDRDHRREYDAAPGQGACRDGRPGRQLYARCAAPGLGRIGVLVALESAADAGKLAEVGKQIAMHIAAANPQFLTIASVDPAAVTRERSVLSEQAAASGKPPAVIEKMVDGRIRKFYEEVVLLEQVSIHRRRDQDRQGVGERGQGRGRPHRRDRLRPLCAGRRDPEGNQGLRRRGRGPVGHADPAEVLRG